MLCSTPSVDEAASCGWLGLFILVTLLTVLGYCWPHLQDRILVIGPGCRLQDNGRASQFDSHEEKFEKRTHIFLKPPTEACRLKSRDGQTVMEASWLKLRYAGWLKL